MAVEGGADRLELFEGGAQQITELVAVQVVDDVPIAFDGGDHVPRSFYARVIAVRADALKVINFGREEVLPRLGTISPLPRGLGATVGKIIMRAARTVVEPSLDSAAHVVFVGDQAVPLARAVHLAFDRSSLYPAADDHGAHNEALPICGLVPAAVGHHGGELLDDICECATGPRLLAFGRG